MRIHLCVVICLLCVQIAFSQQSSAVKGVLVDTTSGRAIGDASVSLLRQRDSALVNYAMSNAEGIFLIPRISQGEYYLLITHIQFHPLHVPVTIPGNGTAVDAGRLVMRSRSDTLKEITVKEEVPPVMMVGDTLQYNAGSFKVRPNSNVEELLKKLPGVQVTRDGTVKVQGRAVTSMLVDGKQFFGNDPKIATRNLQADMVDKVQVFDKLSDQAQWTGFDDGKSEKTINLKLKEDRKKGAFGRMRAGTGTEGRYESDININAFAGDRQLSLIGRSNNINASGDQMPSAGETLNTIWSGGINFNNSFSKRSDFTGSYLFNRSSPRVSEQLHRRYLLDDSSYYYNETSGSGNDNIDHQLQMSIDMRPDSFSALKISPSLAIHQNNSFSFNTNQQLGVDGRLSHEGSNECLAREAGYDLVNEISYRRKLRKAGRTLSFSLQMSFNILHAKEQRSSFNTMFNESGHTISTPIDTLLQHGNDRNNGYGYTARFIYTEPVMHNSLLAFSVEQHTAGNTSEKKVFDYDVSSGKYDLPNALQSNLFRTRNGYTNAGVQWLTRFKRYRYNAGLTLQRSTLRGNSDSIPGKTFLNLLAKAGMQYNFTRYKYLTFEYLSSTTAPSAGMLQPVQDFSNPLFIREGNPDLRQEYGHHIMLSYTGVDPVHSRSTMASLSYMQFMHRIVMSEVVDSVGVRRSKPVNLNGAGGLNAMLNRGFPVDALHLRIDVSLQSSYNRNKQFINNRLNNVNTFSGGPGLHLDFAPLETMNISLAARVDMNATHYSQQHGSATFWSSQYYETAVSWRLPAGLYFGSDFDYMVNSGAVNGQHTSVPLWSAFLSMQFLPYQRAEIKLSVHDILDRNVQVEDITAAGYLESSQGTSLKRFGLITFTYNLQNFIIRK